MKYNRLSLWCVAALAFGCNAGVKGQTGTGGSNSTGTGGTGGSTASGGHGGGTGGTGGSNGTGGSSSGNTDASLDGACAASTVGAQPVPLDLYFLMDSSKSMADPTGAGTSKWTAISSALNAFFTDPGSAGLGIALKYFPDEQSAPPATCSADAQCNVGGTNYGPCDYRLACARINTSGIVDTSSQLCPEMTTTCTAAMETCQRIQDCGTGIAQCVANGTGTCGSGCSNFPGYCHLRDICTPSKYATPNVALGTLPGAASGLNGSLTGHAPDGYTPTGPALGGAVAWAEQQQSSNLAHKVAIVLVTDGLPGGFIPGFPPAECAPSDIPGISTILSNAATGTTPIQTFVVGIFNPQTNEGKMAPANLKSLAQAGGTDDAVIIDVTGNTVTQQLHDALAKAQTKAIACSYSIPPSTGGTGIDFNKVNVQFTGGAGSSATIGHTASSSACDKGGWYYDVDPAAGKPAKILACPSTCSQFNADVSGHVDIVLGCATISVT